MRELTPLEVEVIRSMQRGEYIYKKNREFLSINETGTAHIRPVKTGTVARLIEFELIEPAKYFPCRHTLTAKGVTFGRLQKI